MTPQTAQRGKLIIVSCVFLLLMLAWMFLTAEQHASRVSGLYRLRHLMMSFVILLAYLYSVFHFVFKSSLKQTAFWISYSLIFVFIISFSIFLTFEFLPSLPKILNLQKIRYYALKSRYSTDQTLVFTKNFNQSHYKGILNNQINGSNRHKTNYTASYNDAGFRINSSEPPYDLAFIGDSFIEIGTTNRSTLSEQVKERSGYSTFNLGLG